MGYLLSARTQCNCPFGLLMLQERRLSVGPVPRYSPAHLCQSVDGLFHLYIVRQNYAILVLPCPPYIEITSWMLSFHGASQLICCLLDLFTEREVSAKLVGPGTRSGSACPRSPFSLWEANGRVSISFDLVQLRTQYTYRRIHDSLMRCSAFDIKFEF
jgi:hypothetical protein